MHRMSDCRRRPGVRKTGCIHPSARYALRHRQLPDPRNRRVLDRQRLRIEAGNPRTPSSARACLSASAFHSEQKRRAVVAGIAVHSRFAHVWRSQMPLLSDRRASALIDAS